jgi:HAD domain in Swiss Army Knife RNA repair proteins
MKSYGLLAYILSGVVVCAAVFRIYPKIGIILAVTFSVQLIMMAILYFSESGDERTIIFLDVDGVINTRRSIVKYMHPDTDNKEEFDPDAMFNLRHLIERTNAYVVITSTLRIGEVGMGLIHGQFKKYGIDPSVIIGTTPVHSSGIRGREISMWLEDNYNVRHIVILDDDMDMWKLSPYLVQCHFEYGFTREKLMQALTVSKEIFRRGLIGTKKERESFDE